MSKRAAKWFNSPLVFMVMVDREGRDDIQALHRYMDSIGKPGVYEVMPMMDPRYDEAVTETINGLLVHKQRFVIVDRRLGKFKVAVRSHRKLQERHLRVLFLRGAAPEG